MDEDLLVDRNKYLTSINKRKIVKKINTTSTNQMSCNHFYKWLYIAYQIPPSTLALAPYKSCPLSGLQKYLIFRAGHEWGLSPGFSKINKYKEKQQLRTAFFKASNNYWCVRRCIARWKFRKMKERSSLEILASGDSLNIIPKTIL